MNICYISNSAAPSKNASSLQTAKLCEALSKIGHKVKLVLPDTGYKDENYNNFYNIKNKFEIKTIKYFKKFPTGINYYLYSLFSILISNQKNQNLYITRNFFTSLLLCFFNKKHILEVHDDIQIEGIDPGASLADIAESLDLDSSLVTSKAMAETLSSVANEVSNNVGSLDSNAGQAIDPNTGNAPLPTD